MGYLTTGFRNSLEPAGAAEIATGLARGDRVELRGFGTFTPKTRRARRARNPRTGAAVEVGEKHYLGFRAGKQLHDRLNPVPD